MSRVLAQWSVRPGFNHKSYQRHKKMVLDATLLSTQNYKVSIKDKVEESREGVAISPTSRCSSY